MIDRVILHHIPTNTATVCFLTCGTTHIEYLATAIANVSSDFEIIITPAISNRKPFVPTNISLDNEYLRYFDIIELYKKYNISDKTNEIIAEECAFNEEYCELISGIMESLSNNECAEERELAMKLSNSILGRAIKILEDHTARVNRAYNSYKHTSLNLEQSNPTEDTDQSNNEWKDLVTINDQKGITMVTAEEKEDSNEIESITADKDGRILTISTQDNGLLQSIDAIHLDLANDGAYVPILIDSVYYYKKINYDEANKIANYSKLADRYSRKEGVIISIYKNKVGETTMLRKMSESKLLE